jgi:hypothetical protein
MNPSLSISINHRYNNYTSKFKVPIPANGSILYISSFLDTQNKNTCRTKAEEDRERAAPITTASSTLLMLTCNIQLY